MNRKEFFSQIGYAGSKQVVFAYDLAKQYHKGQIRRFSGERFFEHPRRVALRALKESSRQCFHLQKWFDVDTLLCSALMHDLFEDSFVHPDIILALFGKEVQHNMHFLSKVCLSTKPNGVIIKYDINEKMYWKSISEANEIVHLIKICDRLDNLTDIVKFSEGKRKRYTDETIEYVFPLIKSLPQPDHLLEEMERLLEA